mgnify:CR=1 FL=1
MQMLLFQSMTRSLILLLFIIIDSLNVIVIIAVTDSFLLHAAINRFDSLCMNVSITTDGSFIVVIIPIQDSLTCFIVFNTDL